VTKAERRNGKYLISGMRDPLVADINQISQKFQINQSNITTNWESYLSLEPEMTVKRAKQLLQPPNTALLKVQPDGTLQISGSAATQWISTTRKNWHFIPGITQLDEQNLMDENLFKLQSYQREIEKQIFLFPEGKDELLPREVDKLQKLAVDFQGLLKLSQSLQKKVEIKIIGYTNSRGTESQNRIISQARAKKILAYLNYDGFNHVKVQAIGIGVGKKPNSENKMEDLNFNRRVSLKVNIIDQKNLN
jgi:outer membrane protein OmpA-like peptidoglycan-associated protein